ncbi:hypothetical protein OAI36_00365 [Alphaproteobacteria bacterium]|nr:hypothetical protein [Alphaproteobacteria bacterium]
MAEYEIGDKVYTIPDGTPQATVNDILNQITLGMANNQVPGGNNPQNTDSVWGFAADQAQKMGGKGLEAIGRATGLEGVEKYGTGVVKQQEKDIAEGGYKSKYTKSFSDTWDEDGLDAAFGWVGEKVAENSMTTGASLVGAAATATAALVSAPAALLFGGATLVGSAILGTGEVAGEIEDKTGSYDPNLAVGVGAIIGILDKFGAGKVIPKDQLAKLSAKQIAEKLQKAGFGKASKEFTKRTLKKGGIEFGTEATQESLSIGASAISGGEYTGKEVKDRLIDAGVIGGSMGSGVSVGTDAVTGGVNTVRKVKDGVTSIFETKSDKPSDPDGATELANMLTEISEDNSFDLQDLDKMSQNGARVTVDTAHKQINGYMKQRIKELKAQLKITDIDEFELVEDKILANVGFEEARNKTKNIVGVKEFKSVDKLVGKLREGQELLKYMRMSNELSKLHNSGYQQGLSRITDNFSPIGGGIGYDKGAINTEKVLRPIASGGAAITTGGASLLGQLGIVAGGRAIDKLRGVNKSVVDQYIQDNKDGDGITTIKDPSIRQQAIDKAKQAEQEALLAEQQAAQDQLQKAEDRKNREAANIELTKQGAAPTPGSPQFIVEDATGLTTKQVASVLNVIERTTTNPALKKAIEEYRTSVYKGGTLSNDMLSPLIRQINTTTDQMKMERTNPQNASTMQQQPMQGGGQQSYQNNPNYQRGIDDNKAFADELIEAVNNDTTLSVVDKPILTQALLNLKKNLGSNPIETGTRIIEDLGARLKNPEAIQQFVVPYLQRVTQQQPNQQQQQAEVNDDGIDAMAEPEFNESDPILNTELDPFGLGDMIGITSDAIRPTDLELQQMKDGTFKPEKKQSLVEAYGGIQKLWEQATGRTTPFENTPENVEIIATAMAHEGIKNIGLDGNAIGWYDRKLKAAKAIISSIEPRYQGNEAAFDYVLAVTSNGIAVADNFNYAMEVFREFLDTGRMPENFAKGGERTQAMQNAFKFFNAWNNQYGGRGNMPLEVWLDLNFTRRELQQELNDFNKANNTEFTLSAQEGLDEVVKGSYILGAKIGQGFYQNLRGNYDPLTMDIWWMRMWNRMVGRPFKEPTTEANLKKARNKVERRMKDPKASALEKQIIKKSLKDLGLKRSGLYKDTKRFDAFITQLHKNWNSYYKNYQKTNNKKNPPKPAFFKTVGTHVKNINEGLMATPFDAKERSYMRSVTARAIELMREKGYNIKTADYQALMWFPEKQLARKLGIQQGRGEDNDYLDAAILLAQAEGLTNDQIKETLPTTERGEFDVGSGTIGQNAGLRSENDGFGREEISREESFEDDGGGILSEGRSLRTPNAQNTSDSQGLKNPSRIFPTNTEINSLLPTIKKVLEVGKKGSPQETGLSREEILSVANALGYAMVFAKNKAEMAKLYGKETNSLLGGFHHSERRQNNNPIKIVSMQQGYKNPNNPDQTVNEIDELWTLAHEIAHGLSQSTNQRGIDDGLGNYRKNYQGINYGRSRDAYLGTLEQDLGEVIKALTDSQYVGTDEGVSGKIIKEIMSIQNDTPLMSLRENALGNTKGTRIPRSGFNKSEKQYIDAIKAHQDAINYTENLLENPSLMRGESPEAKNKYLQQMKKRKTDLIRKYNNSKIKRSAYTESIPELLADAVGAYLMSPQQFKSIAPNTAKFIRDNLNNKPSSKFVKFYAHPLGTILAVIMAAFAMDDREEEQPQMQPGALDLGQGALSA